MKLFICGLTLLSIACAQYTEYAPPSLSVNEDLSPLLSYLTPAEHQGAVLADDGYRYKTVRRLRYRVRRDVNELPSADYLPPQDEEVSNVEHVETSLSSLPSFHDLSAGYDEVAISNLAPLEQEENILADDGYRYKTVRRLRHRQRRDVSELPSTEYLPADQEISVEYHAEPAVAAIESHEEEAAAASTSDLARAEDQETLKADDGYRYKTVRRLRHRQRRDVSELLNGEYLPPQHEVSTESPEEVAIEDAAPSNSYLAPVEEEQTIKAEDGYRYKTVRRLRHRNRRDVSELFNAEYLPPNQEISSEFNQPEIEAESAFEYVAPSNSYLAPVEEQETIKADDGYRYKTVRRLRHRNRRDVSELINAEYLPPQHELSTEYIQPEAETEATVEYVAPSNSYLAPVEEQETIKADDGYRYKTVRRLRHRNRRDVSELINDEYLPPKQEVSAEPETSYIAPIEEKEEVAVEYEAPSTSYLAPAGEEETIKADDGYRYKTVRRLRHRNRRDISELIHSEYLPPQEVSADPETSYIAPIEENAEIAVEFETPTTSYLAPDEEEQTIKADDGYRYKTVRRLRHRNRRDVSELINDEYLPPQQEVSAEPETSYIAPIEEKEDIIAEFPTTSYLAPAEEEETIKADDGYRYKTVRRLRHRNRRDVSELIHSEYLPPQQELETSYLAPIEEKEEVAVEYTAPSNSYLAPIEHEETVLADDGYRYKTVKKFKIRRH